MCVSSICLFANLIVPRSWTKSLIVAGKKGGGGGGGEVKVKYERAKYVVLEDTDHNYMCNSK